VPSLTSVKIFRHPRPVALPEDDPLPEGERNSTNHPIPGIARAPGNAKPAHASGWLTRTRIRALRPLLFPPSFPPSLFPIMPIFEPPALRRASHRHGVLSNDRHIRESTLEVDICPVFQRFGKANVYLYIRAEGAPTSSFSRTSTVLSASYMYMLSSPYACARGRSSYLGKT
jgi:hypothetical protein